MKRVVFMLTNGRRTEVVLKDGEATRMLAAFQNGDSVDIAHGKTGGSTIVRPDEIWSREVTDA